MSRNQHGYILVLVLIMIALLTTMVLLFGYESRIDLHLAANLKNETKAYYLAKSGLNVAGWVLDIDEKEVDDFSEPWAMQIFPLPIPEGSISGRITDESAKLSVRSLFAQGGELVDEEYFQINRRLFDILGYDVGVLDALLDWIDPDDLPRGFFGAENNYYRSLKQPFDARNGLMETNYELFRIRWFTAAMILGTKEGEKKLGFPNGLINYMTVYPTEKVNLNTASLPVLMAMNERLDYFEAKMIMDARVTKPFKELRDLEKIGLSSSYLSLLKKYGTVKSDYFSVIIEGTVNESRKILSGIYRRSKGVELIYFREEA